MAELSDAASVPGAGRRVFVETYGCQMNEQDTGKMLRLLEADGWATVDSPDAADLILVNTCSVREKPEQKVRSLLGRFHKLKRARPELMLGLAGCYAQQENVGLQRRFPFVDLVLGPDAIPRLPALVRSIEADREPILATEQLDRQDYPFTTDLVLRGAQPVTAFVTIQKGCDNLCSFCIVPTTRGREVSRPADEVVAEVEALVSRGVREVCLLGQNVNSYGLKRSREPRFHELVARIAAVRGLARIRFTTSNPWDLDHGLISLFATEPKLCGYFHLPVQAGSDSMLARMRRRHDRARYLELVAALREARPDIALSTDIITGFCGETEAEHEETLSLLDAVRFDSIFSFSYDRRPHTPAERLNDDVPREVKRRRLAEVQAIQRSITAERLAAWQGRVAEVLVEGPARRGDGGWMGRISQNWIVNVQGDEEQPGTLVDVRIDAPSTNCLLGSLPGLPPHPGFTGGARPERSAGRDRLAVLAD